MDAGPPPIVVPVPAAELLDWELIPDSIPNSSRWLLRDADGKPLLLSYGEKPRPYHVSELPRLRKMLRR